MERKLKEKVSSPSLSYQAETNQHQNQITGRKLQRMGKIKVVILSSWYDPYRIPLFRELSKKFDLTVFYSMRTEVGREWNVPENLPFTAKFFEPFFLWKTKQMFEELLLIRYPKGLLRELFRIKPDVIVGLEARIDCIVGATW
ncbi:MAG: hypothetical protein D3925_01310, partial [Candidatus Electrothrix sp. AR5]|nr:hypothetical protein [Candidatus Electrothrix sp. AR5]